MTPKSNVLTIRPRQISKAVYQQALAEGVHPLLAKIFAGRLNQAPASIQQLIQPGLQQLAPPNALADLHPSVQRLTQAIQQQETIGILTDYDVDGITAHVVLYRSLTELFGVPAQNLLSLIGHRIEDGYGVSASLVQRILATPQKPSLIITADCGSSDEPRIAQLKAAGIDVIVTDHHHLPPEGPPASAYAVINPSRADCNYPDKTLAGCGVAWLLMAALRTELINQNLIAESSPKLSFLLPFVALGTVADCVSLGGSAINRALVNAGLQLMNASDEACWQAFRTLVGARFTHFDASTLAFQLGPRINASSRMADPYDALHFLLSTQPEQASQHLDKLDSDNLERRAQEQLMLHSALQAAKEQVQQQMHSLVTYLPEGHPGVQGIVASRLVEKFGRPSIVMTPSADPRQLNASARSIDGLSIHAALVRVDQLNPGLLVKFGGHPAAAGLTIWQDKLAEFQTALEKAVKYLFGSQQELGPVLITDGELAPNLLNLDTLNLLNQLEPYGREFEAPLFEGVFTLANQRLVGADATHLQLELIPADNSTSLKAIWFRAVNSGSPLPFQIGTELKVVYTLNANHFRGQTSLQLLVSHAQNLY